jgi:hypothetical protein
MATQVVKRISLDKVKANYGSASIKIKKSKTSGKLYAVTEDDEFLGMLLPDFDKAKAIFLITFKDDESGESWDALGNYEPTAPEYTL